MTAKARSRKKDRGKQHRGHDDVASRRDHAWRDFWLGLFVTGLLMAAKFGVEHTEFGHQIELMTLNLQQLRLSSHERADEVPVVVDISSLPQVPRAAADPELVTDRKLLEEVIKQVVYLKPAAIGVDVLLDPPDALTDDERALLSYGLEAPVPMFVGIFDGAVRGPTAWLGEERFSKLAAYVLIPKPSENPVTTSMIREMTLRGTAEPIQSMSLALARAKTGDEERGKPLGTFLADSLHWLIEREREVELEEFRSVEFPINFGALPQLRESTVRTTVSPSRQVILTIPPSATLEKNVVLIGRAETGKTVDTFTVPAASEPVAGVYVHAAATHTLLAEPLFRPTIWGRLFGDLVAALLPLWFVLRVRLSKSRLAADTASADRFATVLMAITAIGVFVLGYFWIVATGILWTDYLMVVIALLLHRPLERLLHAIYRGLWGSHLKAAVVALVIGASVASIDAAQAVRVVGVVLEIAPPVFLRTAGQGPEITLDPQKDIGRPLFEGQAIRAGAGGRVKIARVLAVEELTPSRGRFELTAPATLTDDQARQLKALTQYGRPGGSRGIGALIHAPADDSVVRLDTLQVRWTRRQSTSAIRFALRDPSGREIWSATAPGGDGRLNDEMTMRLRAAIRTAEGGNAGATAWQLAVRDDDLVIGSVRFRTLSGANERALATVLAGIDRDPDPFTKAIARAFELGNAGLYNDAADELDRLLVTAPQSEALLRAAIDAHNRTGNVERVRELTTRLPR